MVDVVADRVVIKIEGDLRDLIQALQRAQRQTTRSAQRMQKSFDGVSNSLNKVSRVAKLAGVALAAAFAARTLGNVIRTTAEYENLENALNSVFGSIERGETALAFIEEFARQTPFDVQTLTKSMIQLEGAGITPTIQSLTTMGDAAASTVNRLQTFEVLTRTLARSVGGGLGLEELEQLINAGIPVYRLLNEELGITRAEVSEFGQSAEGAKKLVDALFTGLQRDFGGSMEESLKSIDVSISNLNQSFTDFRRTIGEQTSESVVKFNEELTKLIESLNWVAKAIGWLIDQLISLAASALAGVNWMILNVQKAVIQLRALTSGWTEDLKRQYDALLREEDALQRLEAKLLATSSATNTVTTSTSGATDKMQALRMELEATRLAAKGIDQDFIRAFQDFGFSSEDIFDFADRRSDLDPYAGMNVRPDTATEMGKLTQTLRDLDRARRNVAKLDLAATILNEKSAVEQLEEQMRALNYAAYIFPGLSDEVEVALEDLQNKIDEANGKVSLFTDSLIDFGDLVADSFADFAMNGADSLDGIENAFRSFVQQYIAQAIRLLYINKLLNYSLGLSGESALPTGSIPNFFAPRRFGGPVSKGNGYLVGEAGPELFIPNTSGAIVSNNNMGGAIGGVTVVQNLMFESTVKEDIRVAIAEAAPILAESSKQAVQQDILNRGDTARAIGIV